MKDLGRELGGATSGLSKQGGRYAHGGEFPGCAEGSQRRARTGLAATSHVYEEGGEGVRPARERRTKKPLIKKGFPRQALRLQPP